MSARHSASRRNAMRHLRSPTTARIFLGGASENDRFVAALGRRLKRGAEIDSWRTVFRVGESTLESLRRAATTVDFAVFVWGREDRTVSRRTSRPSPRDNVVYEAGLFAGYLGSQRTFVVHAPDTKIPTDYLGVTTIPQTDSHTVGSRVLQAVAHLGPLPVSRIVGCWWQLVTSGELSSSVVSFVELVVQPDTRVISMEGTSWNREGSLVATWHCPAAAFDDQTMILHYSWSGEHVREKSLPSYLGIGQVSFRKEPFVGIFSSTARDLNRKTDFRRARYVRAGTEDRDAVYGTDVQARRRLIRERLRQRAIFGGA